jgi:hypothetical protein
MRAHVDAILGRPPRDGIVQALDWYGKDELWSGPMLVSSLPKQPARAVTHEIQRGRMVPKPAT